MLVERGSQPCICRALRAFPGRHYLPTRPSGAKEGLVVAWGYDFEGKGHLLAVRLGQREHLEDWQELGRNLTRRGLQAPYLVCTDGARGRGAVAAGVACATW